MPASEQPWDLTLIVFVTASSPTKYWTALKRDAQCFLNWSRQASRQFGSATGRSAWCHLLQRFRGCLYFLSLESGGLGCLLHSSTTQAYVNLNRRIYWKYSWELRWGASWWSWILEHNVIYCGFNKTLTEESLKYRFREINGKSFEGLRWEKAVGWVPTIFFNRSFAILDVEPLSYFCDSQFGIGTSAYFSSGSKVQSWLALFL